MKTIQRNRLDNFNRVLIFSLTLGGLLLDGFRMADLLCMLAVFLWLWMPQCTRLEAQLLRSVNKAQRSINRHKHFFPFTVKFGLGPS
jgi:hypothetical protein